MMTIFNYTVSRHLREDRIDRMVEILTTTGFGHEMMRFPNIQNEGTMKLVTSTGVVLIVSDVTQTVLTAYRINSRMLSLLLKGKISYDRI